MLCPRHKPNNKGTKDRLFCFQEKNRCKIQIAKNGARFAKKGAREIPARFARRRTARHAQIALATLIFALWHSFLASLPVKNRVAGVLHARSLTYRGFFMAQSAVTFGALLWLIFSRPRLDDLSLRGLEKTPVLAGARLFRGRVFVERLGNRARALCFGKN